MLISSRTPLRVSFFGGGTDYPEYFSRRPGAVIGMTIDRYIYISALRLSDIIDYKYRVSYSKLERAGDVSEIQHSVVRAVLTHFDIQEPLDISILSDLPASSGLGSSSAFTVGLINLVCALRKKKITRLDLGRAAIHVEHELLSENVGVQDQLHAAFGGLNRFDFEDGRIKISPIQMASSCQEHLLASLYLVYTGKTRFASEIVAEQLKATKDHRIDRELSHLFSLVGDAVDVLEGDDPELMLKDLGALLHDGWQTKRSLSDHVSCTDIDALYDAALASGALGGKLCGAGGGGFLLVVVPPDTRAGFMEALKEYSVIPVGMDRHGSILTG